MICNRSKSYPTVLGVRKKLGRNRIFYGGDSRVFNPFYANDTTAFRPEKWAAEGIEILNESMIFAGTVNRDFDQEVAEHGEIVHTRKNGSFTAKRKQNDLDDIEDQDATATKIQVALDQRIYVSFMLGDADRSLSFKNLVDLYLRESITAQGRMVDRVLAAQVYQFLGNRVGGLESLTNSNGHDYLLDARQQMNDLKVGEVGRWMALASRSETQLQKTDLFKSAERRGDGGLALRNALLGRLAGFDNFLELNTPSVRNATKATATTTTAVVAAGATVVPSTAAVATGTYFTVVGDMTPLRVLSTAGTYNLTVNRPLLRQAASGAAIQPYATGLIDQGDAIPAGDKTAAVSDGYPLGWAKEINVDGTGVPQVGQLVAFKAAGGTVYTPEYGIVEVRAISGGYAITLDRPLETTLADNDVVCYGPNGDFNFGYQSAALTLVNRPLQVPEANTGARAALGMDEHTALRVVMSYDSKKQGTRVTIDSLYGVKVLDVARGLVMLG